MSRFLKLFVKGDGNDHDRDYEIAVAPSSRIIFDGDGNPLIVPVSADFNAFQYLPKLTAPALGYDPTTAVLGTSGVVFPRSLKGGVNLKSQPTSPADNDYALLIGVAATPTFTVYRAASPPRFQARVALNQTTKVVYGIGMDENITDPIPSGTAGDGAAFVFDPDNEDTTMGTAVGAGNLTNWILSQKVNGTDTYINSGVVVRQGIDYELVIQWGTDLKPKYYINGVLVGTSTVANTEGDAAKLNIGGRLNGTPAGVRVDMDIRYYRIDNGGLV